MAAAGRIVAQTTFALVLTVVAHVDRRVDAMLTTANRLAIWTAWPGAVVVAARLPTGAAWTHGHRAPIAN